MLSAQIGAVQPECKGDSLIISARWGEYYLLASSTATVWAEKDFSKAIFLSVVYCECIAYEGGGGVMGSVAIRKTLYDY